MGVVMRQNPWLSLQLYGARHGWLKPVLLAALLACAGVAALSLPSLSKARQQAQDELNELRRLPKHEPAPITASSAPTAPRGLAAFEYVLTTREDLKTFLVEAWDSAARHQLRVTRSEYRIERDAKGGVERLLITVPANGHYPDIRAYAEDLLVRYPGLALQKMRIKRDQSASTEVDAELDFALLLKEEG
jgi:hypothetical protein